MVVAGLENQESRKGDYLGHGISEYPNLTSYVWSWKTSVVILAIKALIGHELGTARAEIIAQLPEWWP